MLLLAELNDIGIAALIALSGAVCSGITWLATFYVSRQTQKRAWKKEDEKGIVDRQDQRITDLVAELRTLQAEVSRCRDLFTQAVSHITYLEGKMEDKGIKFIPFPRSLIGGSGSTEHRIAEDDEGS